MQKSHLIIMLFALTTFPVQLFSLPTLAHAPVESITLSVSLESLASPLCNGDSNGSININVARLLFCRMDLQ